MITFPAVLVWFCVEMTACVFVGVLLFQYDTTPKMLAVYALGSGLYALLMAGRTRVKVQL